MLELIHQGTDRLKQKDSIALKNMVDSVVSMLIISIRKRQALLKSEQAELVRRLELTLQTEGV